MMDNTLIAKPFFQLLRGELWQKGQVPARLSKEQFDTIEQLASQQTVWGLIVGSITRNGTLTGDDNAMRAVGATIGHQRAAHKHAAATARIAAALHKHDIWQYALFKGQAVAACYPHPEWRMPGDIDLYFTPECFERAVQTIADELQVSVNRNETDKHYDCMVDGVKVELHYRVETFGSPRHQRYFDKLVEGDLQQRNPVLTDIGGVRVRTFSPMVHLLVVFKHMFNHFIVEGVGMRQLCDIAMLLGRHGSEFDAGTLRVHLRKMGYLRAYIATETLLLHKFGLPRGKALLTHDTPREVKWARRMLDEVAARGNFGEAHRRNSRQGGARSRETARIALQHCVRFFPLARWEIICLIPRRTMVTLKKYKSKNRITQRVGSE